MDHKPALYALIRLHAELGGKIKDNIRQAEKLAADMIHVEAVLHMLEPGFNARQIAAKRRNKASPLFKRGQCVRAAMDILREAEGPLTSREITLAALASFGVPEPTMSRYFTATLPLFTQRSFRRSGGCVRTRRHGRKPRAASWLSWRRLRGRSRNSCGGVCALIPEFSEFRVVVLWSFMRLPSRDAGCMWVGYTPTARTFLDPRIGKPVPEKGMDEIECVTLFRTNRNTMRDEYLSLLAEESRFSFSLVPNIVDTMRHLKIGTDPIGSP